MDPKDKITELLEKKSLSEGEKQELETLISNDPELRKFASVYRQLGEIIRHSSHLSEEEISEYILYKNGLTPDNKTLISKSPAIEKHLGECVKCSNIFKDLNSEFYNADTFIAETFSPDAAITDRNVQPAYEVINKRNRAPRYAFLTVIFIGLVYLSLYIISYVSTPDYYSAAAINNQSEFSVNRGRATEDFQNSLKALEKHDYNDAIEFLQKDIKQNTNDKTIFYSYYILGLSYLTTAEQDVLGLFPHYNKERATKGSEYLMESIQKNNSGKFTNIKLNAYFYLAKASLMLNDKKSAREYLSKVIAEKGSKMEVAKKLMGELE